VTEFLATYEGARRSWRDSDRTAEARGLYTVMSLTGPGADPLEIAYASADAPSSASVREVWRQRHGRAAAPLLLAVGYPRTAPKRALLCGPTGDDPAVVDVDHALAERLAAAALAEPNRHLAIRFLTGAMDGDPNSLPGLRNRGLLATHALEAWVPQELDWEAASQRARPLLGKRDQDLVRGLGYEIESRGNHQVLRSANGTAHAVAVFLQPTEQEEQPSPRFGNQTPVTAALTSADRDNLPWVLSVRGGSVRLYSTETSGAAGQRGRAETFVELNLPVLPTDQAAYLDLLFSADALREGGTLSRIREASTDYASALSKRLRERVYDEVVPRLAVAVANRADETDEVALQQHYRTALTILFRLLFIAYAEDSRLLPLHVNADYTDHALKTRARRIADKINAGHDLGFNNPLTEEIEPTTDPGLTDLWNDCMDLFHAVDRGAPSWGVPAYNGGLFSPAPDVNPVGGIIETLTLTNGEFGPALTALLVDRTPDGTIGPIDFRSLSVREFGTIYEGLLESELSVAEQDLTLDREDTYIPAREGRDVQVRAGEIYLHNASGARKSSGAYFTKPFAVDHLLDHALEPAVGRHLARVAEVLDGGGESDAADLLFDFRVADVAMGSGHFLTAVVDRLEARYSSFLADHPIGLVVKELDDVRNAALTALGELSETVEIETSSLLRRLIARRCVYGVDINPLSVELARVSMWIHTFVPGLPLSFLNHNLAVGNSLTGVGSVEEAEEGLAPSDSQGSFFDDPIRDGIAKASEPLERLGRLNDATPAQVKQARQAVAEMADAVEPVRRVFDLLTAYRMGKVAQPNITDMAEVDDLLTSAVRQSVHDTMPAHFPIMFPEAFIGDDAGFDVIVGNPPYKEPVIEELAFWVRHRPGLNALRTEERNAEIARLRQERPDLVAKFEREQDDLKQLRAVLHSGPYPGMSDGDPDLYKAFCWRFLHLTRSGGSLGLVLPRSVFATKGSSPWRNAFLPTSDSFVTTVRNTREWVFDDVNPGYTFVFLTVTNLGEGTPELRVAGRYASMEEYRAGLQQAPVQLNIEALQGRDDTLALPDLRSDSELALFADLLQQPTLGDEQRSDFLVKPVREFDVSIDRKKTKILKDDGDWPVYNHLNVGHFRFEPSEGEFTRADLDTATAELRRRKLKGARNARSPFSVMFMHRQTEWLRDDDALPALEPRVIFRDVIHASNPRKVWAAVAPARTLLTNPAPYLLFARGGLPDQAYLLAMMNSSVCDWYAHLFVDKHLNYFILNTLPIPEHDLDDPRCQRAIQLAAFLATDGAAGDLGGWPALAADDQPDRVSAVAEIDALASLLYGLTDRQLPLVWDDSRQDLDRPALASVQQHRRNWS
jgi:hypothetical protein